MAQPAAQAGKAPVEQPEKIVPLIEFQPLKINGATLSVLDLQTGLAASLRDDGGSDSDARRAAVRNDLAVQTLLAQQAQAKGLDKLPLLESQLRLAESKLLAQAYFAAFASDYVVDEKALRQDYERVAKNVGDTEYNWSQIVLGSQSEAQQVLEQLSANVPFGTLAKAQTLDLPRRAKSGSMGWSNPAQLRPEITAVLKSLKPGQAGAKAVAVDAAWHVVKLESTRPFTAPPYDSVKTNLGLRQLELAFDKHIEALKSQAKLN